MERHISLKSPPHQTPLIASTTIPATSIGTEILLVPLLSAIGHRLTAMPIVHQEMSGLERRHLAGNYP